MAKILCGPAIRRTDENQIHLWIALDAKASSMTAHAKTALAGPAIGRETPASREPIQMGQNLFLYLLKVVPEPGSRFPVGKKVYYDLEIEGENLQAIGLTSGDRRITYSGEKLPSLVIPAKHNLILQASCRKPHAKLEKNAVQRDQMQKMDALLEAHFTEQSERLTMLVLTGDQIYGDDVASPMIAALRPIAREMMGGDEWLPDLRYGGRKVNPAELKLGERNHPFKALSRSLGFTSTHGKNHLMGAGEYFAMYFAVWGGLKLTLPSWSEASKAIGVGFERKKRQTGHGRYNKYFVTSGEYNGELNRLNQFLEGTWKTRRLLANVPSYMMFDDHEVTDDWNLEQRTQERLAEKGSLGRRLTANALAAYWGCQGWGNDPDAFDDAFKKSLSRFYASLDYEKSSKAEDALHKRYWGFVVKGFPALIAIDTRTARSFGRKGSVGPALLNDERLNWLRREMKDLRLAYSGQSSEQSLLILSPAPVLGFEPIEKVQEGIVKLLPFTKTVFDAEYWNADPIACRQFKQILADEAFTENVIFLSGDVHYGYCVFQRFSNGEPNIGPRYFQLTSSAVCNHLSTSAGKIFDKIADRELDQTSHYLAPQENLQKRLNLDNNVGALWLKEGLPDQQVLHCFNDVEKDYPWSFDLKNPKLA